MVIEAIKIVVPIIDEVANTQICLLTFACLFPYINEYILHGLLELDKRLCDETRYNNLNASAMFWPVF